MKDRDFDLVLWGATGFTGRLVAEHLVRAGKDRKLRWAVGGRDADKLGAVLRDIGAPRIPVLLGDSHDADSLAGLARSARAICSTVGPYALHGSGLVAACAEAGTHYCDLSGEVHWMRQMIDAHEARATETGARIVHSCGFDSVPSDLGCQFLQEEALARYGRPCSSVKLFVRRMKGTFSGGTVASMLNALDAAKRNPDDRRVMGDPYALNPAKQRKGPDGRDQVRPLLDSDADGWTAPFVMASVNTRIVRRSHALLGWPWGHRFRYTEAVLTGEGAAGFARAAAVTAGLGAFMAAASLGPTRAVMNRLFLPQPGEGPDEAAREAGGFEMLLIGRHPTAPERQLRARVVGRRDPGYGATARMLGEAALCLALDEARLPVGGGSWTPATAFGGLLRQRLEERADISFTIDE
ncbi:saccharopine dehydrogenase NADP-binding domain-containing protein [Wenzhouxiangella sp. XN24]|uniref:saccharopine dehydrogenase family protein n=1 Tax=Wenzhouxiangella sp. XN24 TaxID=2713569 RepID=UPI0013EA3CA0|nr:saccharopine dehydrogenase NADP-binding domain-containing protein [Wenzhouxiangella sp. XN24]NGX14917.1 NAD(P)H-binding protein [Wenzhouxiangella sp. XN24]